MSSPTTSLPTNRRTPQLSLRRFLLLWLPAGLIASSILLPILYLIIRAFGGQTSASELIFRTRTLEILMNSLLLAITVTVASAAISLPIAWLTVRTDLPGKRLWSILTALPLVIPSYIGAYLMASALGPKGIVQGWLAPLGVERLPSIYGFPGAALVLTLLTYPYILLNVRAALQGMDPALEEASRILGHSSWKTFWRVTFPQLRPSLLSGGLLVSLYALRDFGAVSIMRFNTFTRALFVQYQSLIDRSGAAALALVLILVTIVILFGESRARQNRRIYSSGSPSRPPTILKLGKWKWPALLFLSIIVLFALAMPAVNLTYWLIRGMQAGEQISSLWLATQNSILAASLAAGAALLATLPISILSVRYPGKLTSILERITYIGYSLPGVVIALALVFFGANYIPFLYQTFAATGICISCAVFATGSWRSPNFANPGSPQPGRSGPQPGPNTDPRLRKNHPADGTPGPGGRRSPGFPNRDERTARDLDLRAVWV